jgi:hypothetical protein
MIKPPLPPANTANDSFTLENVTPAPPKPLLKKSRSDTDSSCVKPGTADEKINRIRK